MTEIAICIGVDETGGLARLGGAATGAEAFAEWAEAQGMTAHRITDATEPVTLSRIHRRGRGGRVEADGSRDKVRTRRRREGGGRALLLGA